MTPFEIYHNVWKKKIAVYLPSDLSSALEVCFKRDALNKSMFTVYFTLRLLYFTSTDSMSSFSALFARF